MTNFERASLRMRADGFRPFTPDHHTARCGRVLRRPDVVPPAEPDAKPIDRVIAAVGIIGIAAYGIARLIERLAA